MCGNSSDDRDCKNKGLFQKHVGVVAGDSEASYPHQRQCARAQTLNRINSPKKSVALL